MMDEVVQITGACFDVEMQPPSAADALVQWLQFGRREQPRRSSQFSFGPIDLSIGRGALVCLSGSTPLLNQKVFAGIDGRKRPSAGAIVVNGLVSSAPRTRATLSNDASVGEALMDGLLALDRDADEAKRQIETAFLFAGLLDLAFVRVREVSEIDRARIATAACLLCDADVYLLDEISLMYDTGMRDKIRARVRLLAASGKTVILATSTPDWLPGDGFPLTRLDIGSARGRLAMSAR